LDWSMHWDHTLSRFYQSFSQNETFYSNGNTYIGHLQPIRMLCPERFFLLKDTAQH
jgi:hypothetical protein